MCHFLSICAVLGLSSFRVDATPLICCQVALLCGYPFCRALNGFSAPQRLTHAVPHDSRSARVVVVEKMRVYKLYPPLSARVERAGLDTGVYKPRFSLCSSSLFSSSSATRTPFYIRPARGFGLVFPSCPPSEKRDYFRLFILWITTPLSWSIPSPSCTGRILSLHKNYTTSTDHTFFTKWSP